jgi:hypothetical protein
MILSGQLHHKPQEIFSEGGMPMKVKEGDVLICRSKDCEVELTVTKACDSAKCGVECDLEVSCHGGPMELKKK